MVLRNEFDAFDFHHFPCGLMEIRNSNFKVYLRTISSGDAGDIARNANDPEITRNVARFGEFPSPYTEEHALSFISSLQDKQAAGIESHFSIILDGKTVGACALMGIDGQKGQAEIGYWLGREYWGRGYAKEALMLLLGFAFGRLDLGRAFARTFRSNERSIKLLNSLGFSEVASTQEEPRGDETEYCLFRKDYPIAAGLEITDE